MAYQDLLFLKFSIFAFSYDEGGLCGDTDAYGGDEEDDEESDWQVKRTRASSFYLRSTRIRSPLWIFCEQVLEKLHRPDRAVTYDFVDIAGDSFRTLADQV
jgi:hypothetical protein